MARDSRNDARRTRHVRLRKRISGTPARPRLMVRRSLHHTYAMLIDDANGHTLVSASTVEASVSQGLLSKTNLKAAKAVGSAIAGKAKDAGIQEVVFDRGGYKYHGRVRALAEAAREAGLTF
jgi:large subunit ribosomal protein L18